MSDQAPHMLKRLWWEFTHGFGVLTGDGRWQLSPLLLAMVDHVTSHLDKPVAQKINAQLSQRYYTQYWGDRRINPIFFFELPDELLISDPLFHDCLYKISLFVDGKRQISHVNFYKGRIFSVELKKPHKFYDGKKVEMGDVVLGKALETFTSVINRAEHGKTTETNP